MRKTYLDLADNEIARLDLILLRTLHTALKNLILASEQTIKQSFKQTNKKKKPKIYYTSFVT